MRTTVTNKRRTLTNKMITHSITSLEYTFWYLLFCPREDDWNKVFRILSVVICEMPRIFLLHRKFLCNKKSSAKDAHSRARKMLLSQPRSARESACGLFVLHGKSLWTQKHCVGCVACGMEDIFGDSILKFVKWILHFKRYYSRMKHSITWVITKREDTKC